MQHLACHVLTVFSRDPFQTSRDPRNLYLFLIYQLVKNFTHNTGQSEN
ncbi:hypothetical protein HMPREF0758_4499 [Serratia odorifera DSM 4582]|uniref:Uncharacterized protein n=1 Tax=Serratia odorifera DSM 4582 TaxID=667129 RepID=D4E8J9_SEROD|nr:hypothetical protein HMPREF0758_4499 [Serratia odorifera DSM 4582]